MTDWTEFTDDERAEKILNIGKDKTGLTNFNKHGVFYKFLQLIITIVNNIYSLITTLKKQTTFSTATGAFLDLWGILIGCERKLATKTVRKFICTSFSAGSIPEGTFINVVGTDLRFKTIKDTSFEANSQFCIDVIAEFSGSNYNISNNYDLTLSKVIYGIENIKIPADDGFIKTLGSDEENDESYRTRIKAHWKSLNENSVKAKYKKIALETEGVLDSSIIRAPRGGGSVDVVLAIADGYSPDDVIYSVTQRLYDYEIICRDLIVRKCNEKLINLTINYKGNITDNIIRATIENFFSLQKIGQPVILAELYTYLLNKLNFESLIINPNQNIFPAQYEIVKLNVLEIIKDA